MDERGVSTVVSYVLVLGIAAILVSGVFTATGVILEREHEQTIRSEMEVVGNQVAADIAVADRLATHAGASGNVTVTSDVPDRIARAQYRIEIVAGESDGQYEIRLQSVDPAVRITVDARSDTPVEPGTVDGGTLEIVSDTEAGTLEVRNG